MRDEIVLEQIFNTLTMTFNTVTMTFNTLTMTFNCLKQLVFNQNVSEINILHLSV